MLKKKIKTISFPVATCLLKSKGTSEYYLSELGSINFNVHC